MFSQNGRKLNNNQGFTLVEILVVTAIIIVLSAIVIPHYRVGDQHFRVQRSAHQLSQDLRRVEEMAMGAAEIGKGIVAPGDEFYPDGGFGIHFDYSPMPWWAEEWDYVIFADCNGDGKLNPGNRCESPSESSPKHKFPELIEGVYFESKVEIGSLASTPPLPLYVIFRAPYPSILISGGTEATIDLWLQMDNTKIKTVKVNEAGLIYVE